MKNDTPELKTILNFLHKRAMEEKSNPLEAIVEFINTEPVQQIYETVIDSVNAPECPEYYTYFETDEDIEKLAELKESDANTYYKVISYETVLVNLLAKIINLPFFIVMPPDNLEKTYFIKLSAKSFD